MYLDNSFFSIHKIKARVIDRIRNRNWNVTFFFKVVLFQFPIWPHLYVLTIHSISNIKIGHLSILVFEISQ